MKKEGWILVVLLGLFIGTIIGMNLPFYITGLTTGNTSIGTINEAPSCSTVLNQTWDVDTVNTLNISEYCTDPENYDLVYNFTSVSEITISITNGVATFTPNSGFSGIRLVTFSAFDYVNTVYTNNVTLNVSETVSAEVTPTTGGGGTASVVASAEGEQVILYLTPKVEFGVANEYYLDEYFVGDTAKLEDLEINYIIYFGSNDDADLAYVQIALIEEEKLLLNFVDKKGSLLQLEFIEENYFELDENGDELSDYVVYADYIGNSVVDLRFIKVKNVSFELFYFVSEYWFLIVILMVILSLIIVLLKKKV